MQAQTFTKYSFYFNYSFHFGLRWKNKSSKNRKMVWFFVDQGFSTLENIRLTWRAC